MEEGQAQELGAARGLARVALDADRRPPTHRLVRGCGVGEEGDAAANGEK